MAATTTWVLAYDISKERQRRRCRRALRAMAAGYQKSVFEVEAPQEAIQLVAEDLHEGFDDRDSLLAARVLPFAHSWQLGCGYRAAPGDLIVIA